MSQPQSAAQAAAQAQAGSPSHAATVHFDGRFPRHRQAIPARNITKGDRFMHRSGLPSEPVQSARVVKDSFGTDAYVDVVLEDGSHATVAINSTIRVFTERNLGPGIDELLAVPVEEGSAEAALVEAAKAHRKDAQLLSAALRVAPGINTRAGSHLDSLVWAAFQLAVVYEDTEFVWPILNVLTQQSFEDNATRWLPTRYGLALACWLARQAADHDAATGYAQQLKGGEEALIATLPGTAREIHRRQLEHASLYDREIQRARDSLNAPLELEFRWSRLKSLMVTTAYRLAFERERPDFIALIERELPIIRAASGEPREHHSTHQHAAERHAAQQHATFRSN